MAVALAVEPAEQDGDGAGVVAQPVAGAVDDAQLGDAVGVGETRASNTGHWSSSPPCIDQQRAGREPSARIDRADLAQLAAPAVERRGNAGSR